MSEYVLDVWKGDWGLSSVDPQSLSIMAYFRLSGVPVKINKVKTLWNTFKGSLPVLHHQEEVICGMNAIMNYLKEQGVGCDVQLTAKDQADIVVFSNMIQEKLYPTLLYMWWLDNKMYRDTTRSWYGRALVFPYTMIYPNLRRRQVKNYITHLKNCEDVDSTMLEAKLYRDAKTVITCLESMLQESKTFFQTGASSLDALMFGFVAPILKVPFSSQILSNHLRTCPVVKERCQQILQEHFPLTVEEQEEQRCHTEEERQNAEDSAEFPNRTRNMIICGAVAFGAMFTYALFNGITISWGETTDQDNDDD